MSKEAQEAVLKYYRDHAVCPHCGTPIGHDKNNPVEVDVTGMDANRASCPNPDCDGTPGDFIVGTDGERTPSKPWEGIIHELVPKGESKADKPVQTGGKK